MEFAENFYAFSVALFIRGRLRHAAYGTRL